MDKLKTDGDIMVYLRNIRDNLEKIAEKTGQEIHLYVNGKDYGSVETGGYIAIKVNGRESYQYRLDEVKDWRHVEPDQIAFEKGGKNMTFREKLQQELPTFVNEKWWGGCNGCPDTYGYEIESDCIALDDETDEDKKRHCAECWDREAPKEREEPKEMTFAEIEQALGHPVKIVGDSHESDQ